MTGSTVVAQMGLFLEVLIGLAMTVQLGSRHGGRFSVGAALLLMYLVVIPISGLVHLADIEGATRGFYDVLAHPGEQVGHELLVAVELSYLGLAAIWLGAMLVHPRQGAKPDRPTFVEASGMPPRMWLTLGLVVLGPSLLALNDVAVLRASIDSTRVWGFDGGNARLAFLAGWAPWGITFVAIALGSRLGGQLTRLLVLVGAVLMIYQVTAWSGGRSLALVYAVPIVVVMLPTIGRLKIPAVLGGVAAAVFMVIEGTLKRTATFRVQGVNPAGIVDWEWGRFSMSGFATSYVNANGILYGETYLRSILEVPVSILRLVGLELDLPFRSAAQVAGGALLGSESLSFIVPGALAESYLNLGAAGVLIVMLGFGAAASLADNAVRSPKPLALQLLLWYLVSLLLFRGLVAESLSFGTYIVFNGLPLLLAVVVATQFERRKQSHMINKLNHGRTPRVVAHN